MKRGTYIWVDISYSSKEYINTVINSLNINESVPVDDLHITLLYSAAFIPNIDWLHNNTRTIKEIAIPTHLDWFCINNDCLVLLLKSQYLSTKNNLLTSRYGINSDYSFYTPHITLAYNVKNYTLPTKFVLPIEPIHLISEHYRLIDDN